MRILLTGATGFIGKALARRLIELEHEVYAWVRDTSKATSILDGRVRCIDRLEEIHDVAIDAVINLAGEPIADERWTDSRKQILLDSRIGVTNQLVEFFRSKDQQPAVVLSGSAIGFYGSQDRHVPLDESAEPVPGFSHTLCQEWEAAAQQFASNNTRVCFLRTGVVLGKDGGALKKLLLPFRLGLGGPIGNGQQIMSWIHLKDWINACLFLLTRNEISGPVNMVSSGAVDNETFTRSLARAVHRPAFFRVPCFMLKLMMGEASELLCEGQRVIPKKLLFAGFQFQFTHIDQALGDII